MSVDAYSPITGRWGVEGIWDVAFVGLAIVALAVLAGVLGRSRRERLLALIGALAVIPAYLGIGWLGGVQIEGPGGDQVDCLMRGKVDFGTDCGAAYLGRYAALMVPLMLLLIALLLATALNVRGRLRRSAALGA